MDLGAPSYQSSSRIQGRLLANVEQMRRYTTDTGDYRYSINVPDEVTLTVAQQNIRNYVLDLGVPAEPNTMQWQAICLALQKAEDRVALDGKTIDFKVKDIA